MAPRPGSCSACCAPGARLWRAAAGLAPDVVVVGYLGHLDVHLARRRFPSSTIVLDHMVSLSGTLADRGLGGGPAAPARGGGRPGRPPRRRRRGRRHRGPRCRAPARWCADRSWSCPSGRPTSGSPAVPAPTASRPSVGRVLRPLHAPAGDPHAGRRPGRARPGRLRVTMIGDGQDRPAVRDVLARRRGSTSSGSTGARPRTSRRWSPPTTSASASSATRRRRCEVVPEQGVPGRRRRVRHRHVRHHRAASRVRATAPSTSRPPIRRRSPRRSRRSPATRRRSPAPVGGPAGGLRPSARPRWSPTWSRSSRERAGGAPATAALAVRCARRRWR